MRLFNRISLLIVAAVVAYLLFQRFSGALGSLPLPRPLQPAQAIEVRAKGQPPWTIEGHGIRYTVAATARTTSKWMGKTKPSIIVTSYVTRTEKNNFTRMNYRFSDQSSGTALESVPFQGSGDGDPPLNQRSKLVNVVWDVTSRANRLTITLHDFYWPDGRDLVLRDIPVPSK